MSQDIQPICYSDVDSILEALRNRFPDKNKRPPYWNEEISCITRFLRHNKLFEDKGADYATSLIILEGAEPYHIRADLNVSPEIETLPIIKRTGTSSPSMRSYLLHKTFLGDFAADPDLQRTKSLFMTKESAVQERSELLFRISKMVIEGTSLTQAEVTELLSGDRRAEELYKHIEVAKNLLVSQSTAEEPLKDLSIYLSRETRPPEKIEEYVKWRFCKQRVEQPSERSFDKELLKNLIIAMFLARHESEKLYNSRHLGRGRLEEGIINDRFSKNHKLYNMIIQGAGDLSMNEWNLAYVRREDKGRVIKEVIIPEPEPFSSRTYNCLLAWRGDANKSEVKRAADFIARERVASEIEGAAEKTKPIGASLGADLSITELRFSRGEPYIQFPKDHPSNLALDDLVSFAIYGKIILRDGEIVPPDEIVDEFQDIRHVFALPNLNPSGYGGFPEAAANEIKDWVRENKGTQETNERIYNRIEWIEGLSKENINFWKHFTSPDNLSENDRASLDWMVQAFGHHVEEVIIGHKKESQTSWAEIARERTDKPRHEVNLRHERKQQTYWAEIAEEIWHRNDDARQSIEQRLEGDPASKFLVSHFSELRYLLNHPRHLFGQLQRTDVWLLEHALLKDRSLRHLACSSAIGVDLVELGAPKNWITLCLLRNGYQQKNRLHEVKKYGDFAWDESDHPRLVIRPRMNTYPCTIIGIGNLSKDGRQNNALYLLAWGHDFTRGNHTIWDCAEVLKAAGARYALVMDEGQDVFQCHLKGEILSRPEFIAEERSYGEIYKWMPVPLAFKIEDGIRRLNRRGLRASLAFWQERKA